MYIIDINSNFFFLAETNGPKKRVPGWGPRRRPRRGGTQCVAAAGGRRAAVHQRGTDGAQAIASFFRCI